jgi:flavin reductase (DIM6/NTAB) family NADH-FMN oxidoreductase RutF
MKDTATNIIATGEFVVNLVCEADAETMNLSSVDAPREISEIDYAGIVTVPSETVAPPRIASSPVSFECRKVAALDIGALQTVVIGEVQVMHVADEFIANPEKLYLDTPAMKLIGRTHGAGWYARTSDQFVMERPRFDPERAAKGKDGDAA